eukprot:Em0002g912a
MDNSYSLSSEDKQTWKYLFGPGSLREDPRQSTVDRIVERVIPLLTLKSLRVGKLIPFLEKRNVIAPDSLANLKMDTKQVDSICDLISANQTPHTLFCLYASLSESGKEVPIHDQLACDIRDIIQSECVEDDSVGGLQERGAVRSQSSAQATRSPNNTQEMSEQKSGVFCVLPAEATRTPNPTGNQGSSNSTGDTNASREHHLADGIPTPLPSCKGSHPRQFVPGSVRPEDKQTVQSECVEDDSVGRLQERGAVRSLSSAQATRSPNNTQEMAVQSECVEDDSVGGLQERGAVRSQSSAQATRSPNNTQEMSEQRSGVFCVLSAEATRTPNPTGDKGSSNSTGDTNASREHHLADGIPTPLPSCKGSHPRQFVPGSVRPEDKQTVQSECVEDDSVGRLQERGAVRSLSSAQATRSPNNTQEMAEQKSGVFCVLPAEATRTPNPTGDQGSSNSTGDTNASREHHLADGILTPLTSCKGSHPRQFVLGSVRPALSLSSPDSTSSGSLKNSLSSVMENAVPLSQANDFGTSISQNDLIAPSSATSPPIELCDRNLLAEFNNPNESDVFALLVQTGASVNLPTNHERSYFLHLAIGGVMFDKVQVLLQYGADTNVAREDGRTPLHLACEQQLIELVRLLVEHGANVNAVDNCGMTCLHLMNTLEEPDIVNYLIQQGAQLHVDVPTKDGFNTPLTIATGLLKETAKRTVSLLLQAGASANGHPQSAVRPLVAAASRGHVDTVELLLSAGANVNLANKDGTTALMAAVLDNHQNIVQLLLDKGADLSSVRSGPYSVSGNITSMSSTALSDAAYLGNLPLVKLLKEKGAKLTAGSQEEKAPIVFAAMGGDVQVVDYIVTNGEIPENELLEAFEAVLKHRHDNCAVVLLNSSKGKDKMREAATQHCTGERLEKMFKSIGAGAVQGPSSSSQMSGPDSHLPSLMDAPRRAILPGMAPSVIGIDDLFQAVQALPPARRQPARSRSMYRSGDDDHHLMSEGLGQEAHKLIEILHEFAQVCLQAALNNRSCDWLIDHAKRCHHSQLVDFFTSYYTHGATSVDPVLQISKDFSYLHAGHTPITRHDKKMSTASIRYGNCRILDQIDPSKFVADFFHGEPSVLTFLIQRNIISKARVQEVLNDMGRNSVDFFTELMEAFHHIPGTDHLPYDGDLVANHLFDGTIVIGKYYKPSSELFSTDSSERQSTMPTTGGHRLGGSAPPANMRDLYSQQTSQHSSQQARQQSSQQTNQQSSQQASQQTSQQASQRSSQQASQQIRQLTSQQTNQQASQQASNLTRQQGDQFSAQQPPPQEITQNQPLQSQSQSNSVPKLQQQLSNSLKESSVADKARLLSVSSLHASACLSVVPSPGLGLSLDPNEHQMAIKWWLGLNTSPGSPPCALCPEHPLDPLSHHAVTCKRGGDAISRHNKLRDVVLQTYHRACISAKAEAGSGLGHELWNTRPADILASNWLCGKPAAFDLTVVSPLNPTFISEAGRTAGSAAVAAELWKHSANDAKCSELGWTCIPLVAESYGAWGSEAVLAFSRLASYLATRTNSPKSKVVCSLYGRLNLTLVRANARALLL